MSSKKEVRNVNIPEAYEYAALCALIDNLVSIKETKGKILNDIAQEEFIKEGIFQEGAPDSFNSDYENSSVNFQLKKRSTRSVLNQEEIDILTKAGITTEKIETRVETYIINPKYKNNTKILNKVVKTLTNVKGIPDDLFLKQESDSQYVVGKDVLNEIFEKKRANSTYKKLLDIASIQAIVSKFEGVIPVKIMKKFL